MKKFLLSIFIICFCVSAKAQLTGIVPNQAQQGQTGLNTTITGSGIFIQSSSPSGNLYDIYLQQGATTIYLFDWNNQWNYNVTVTDPNTVEVVGLNIPGGAPLGAYDLHVTTGDVLYPWMNQNFYTLPGAFTVSPPDGYVSGTVYNDINANGIQDGGELGLANQSLVINPGGYTVITDVNGDYSYGLFNGSYTVQWAAAPNYNYSVSTPAVLNFTINNNNSSGNDFGLETAITNIAINYSQIGTTAIPVITSDSLFSVAPSNVYLRKATSPYNYIFGTGTTVLDIANIYTLFAVPMTSSLIGSYDLYVVVSGITYKVPAAFTIILFVNGITGNVYFDTNGNGIMDTGELPVTNGQVQLTPGNLMAYSDNTGLYGFATANGNYTVQYVPKYYEVITSVPSYNVTVNNNVVSGNDFGVQVMPGFDSLSLAVSHWFLRCNWNHPIYITVANNGFGPVNGRMFFLKDPTMSYYSATPPADYVSGDTAYWNFSNLLPGHVLNITAVYSTPAAGITCNFHIIAEILDAGNNVTFTNQQDFTSLVSCSNDPNDKQVNPPGEQPAHYTLFSDDLYYTIRFQNTGTDTAFKVVILDTLDSNLDYSTFAFISSTHQVKTELNPANGALKFTFDNIFLPDSNVDEPGSHGEITYRIRTQAGLPAPTVVNNTAYIYFDLNTPVITNTAFNTMVYVIPVGIDEAAHANNAVVIYPNPLDASAVLSFENKSDDTYTLIISDVNGRKVMKQETTSDKISINKAALRSGLYFYQLYKSDHAVNYNGKFVIR